MNREDWGFAYNETEDGNLKFYKGAKLMSPSLLLDEREYTVLQEMAEEMGLSTHGVLKQGLRLLQMYRAGYLVDNSPKSGGCGACE